MSPWLLLGVSVFGGLGAVARFAQDSLVKSRVTSGFPWGTVSINVLGSLVLGVLTGLVVFGGEPDSWRVVLGVGFCGGYTTFSTAMVEAVTLARDARARTAAVSLAGTLVASVTAAALGVWLGALF